MTKYALSVAIECKTADRDAANKLLESLGWGPNNINVPLQGNKWTTSVPCNQDMIADLQRLADEHPKLDIKIVTRPEGQARAKEKCKADAVGRFDKPEHKETATNRKKAKVDLTI